MRLRTPGLEEPGEPSRVGLPIDRPIRVDGAEATGGMPTSPLGAPTHVTR